MRRLALILALALALPAPAWARNVVLFVADGLRYDNITPDIAPTLWKLRHDGVDFVNSHALYPTVTMANASAIATGHYLGDTGSYANTLFVDFPDPCRHGVTVVFLESDCILADMKAHFGDGYAGQTTLVQAARAAGMTTMVLGKTGPTAIQNLDALSGNGLLIDEATNRPTAADGSATKGPVLKGEIAEAVSAATGLAASPAATVPDVQQEAYQTKAADALVDGTKPFLLVFWSRDPDHSQHNARDSDGALAPGINGATQHRGIANADAALRALMDSLKRKGVDKDTDIFVTADHGFLTAAHGIPEAGGDTPSPTLPQGFLAFAIGDLLGEKVFDPDKANAELNRASGDHPVKGSALIGPSAEHPRVAVAANGGSDFIYVPGNDAKTVAAIFAHLTTAPYVASILVNDALLKGHEAEFKGALPMSALDLIGAGTTPQPVFVVGYRSFLAKGCKLTSLLCAAGIMDAEQITGRGNHGGPSRAETRNFMAAIGPDFKAGFKDPTPVGNADVAPTLAHILGLNLGGKGELTGRVASEALKNGKPVPHVAKVQRSDKAPSGFQTILQYQEADGRRYFDAMGMPGRVVGLTAQ